MAGSERCSNQRNIEDGLKPWQIDSRYEQAKERVKEGKYINKSLFFLTQVINCRTNEGHVPYRNTALTKILKSSLCGNTRTCVILCLSPARSQLEYSLQTLKFGLSVSKIETKAEKNFFNVNSEETLKLLIDEYKAKISLLNKNTSNNTQLANISSIAPNKNPEQDKILFQFYIEDEATGSIGCINEPGTNTKLENTFIEALKLSCKQSFYWKARAQALEAQIQELLQLTAEQQQQIITRNNCLKKLIEVTEDCFKTIKLKAAKLEVYEYTEKWIHQLSKEDLKALALHFKSRLDQIQSFMDTNSIKSNISTPKLELRLKYNKSYISSLLKETKPLLDYNPQPFTFKQNLPEVPEEEKLYKLIESIKKSDVLKIGISLSKSTTDLNEGASTKTVIKTHNENPQHKYKFNGYPQTPNARNEKVHTKSTSPKSTKKHERGSLTRKDKRVQILNDKKSYNNTVGIFSDMQSLRKLKQSLKQRRKRKPNEDSFINKSLDESKGEIYQSWKRIVSSIGLK